MPRHDLSPGMGSNPSLLCFEPQYLKKAYDKATDDYSAALAKLDSAHKDPKKSADILKVYALEKERVRTKKIYDNAILELTSHCEEVNEKLNFDFLDMLVANIEAEKVAYQAMSGLFGEVAGYLDDLGGWCEEERVLFAQHTAERTNQRNAIHDAAKAEEERVFLGQFTKPIIDIIRPIARTGESAVDIAPLLLALLRHHQMNIPEGIDTSMPPSPYDSSLDQTRLAVKNNFDAIGLALAHSGMHDRIAPLSEALAGVEPFQATPITPATTVAT